jgi:hypothetical protein
MTIANIANYGIPAGTVYTPEMDRTHPINRSDLDGISSRDIILRDRDEADSTIQPIERFEPSMGERPDFAAINLLKNSFPEPPPQNRMFQFNLDDFVTGASSRPDQPQMSLDEYQAQQEVKAQIQQVQNNRSVHDAVAAEDPNQATESAQSNFELNSSQGVPSNNEAFQPRASAELRNPQTVVQEARINESINESATTQTSYDIAQRESGNQLTPAQQQGVEVYERGLDYTDSVNVSVAGTQMAA